MDLPRRHRRRLPGMLAVWLLAALLAVGTARASVPGRSDTTAGPAALTGEARVDGESVVLDGMVDPDGAPVEQCFFEYGESAKYGKTAPCAQTGLGAGTVAEAVSTEAIKGLPKHVLFHYRLLVVGAGGTGEGAEATFTSGPSAKVLSMAATALGETGATLNGSVDPEGERVSACYFEWGPSTAYGQRAPCSGSLGDGVAPVSETASLTGLAPGATYDFRIAATTVVGTAFGANETIRTLAKAPQASSPPATEPVTAAPLPFLPEIVPRPITVLAGTRAAVLGTSSLTLLLTCPQNETTCWGTVTVRTAKPVPIPGEASKKEPRSAIPTLASGYFSVFGGRVESVTLRLSSIARSLLAGYRPLPALVTIAAHDLAGKHHTTRTNLTLRLARPVHPKAPTGIRARASVFLCRRFLVSVG